MLLRRKHELWHSEGLEKCPLQAQIFIQASLLIPKQGPIDPKARPSSAKLYPRRETHYATWNSLEDAMRRDTAAPSFWGLAIRVPFLQVVPAGLCLRVPLVVLV